MSAKDTEMIPAPDDSGGDEVLGCRLQVVEVGGVGACPDRVGMEKVASSPDSAIDLTEDAKVEAETKGEDLVNDLLDDLLTEITQMRRRRKKKRARFTDSEKWGLMKDCGLVGWKRILARNCDDGAGWGFNFVAPTGVRLTARELEKFLKKRKLTMEELSFVAKSEGAGESEYPRKKAKLKMGYPKFKMRDLKLSKAEEIARRKLQSQTRLKEKMAEWGEFKSISEYLASLDNSHNSSCSDLSRLTSDPDPDSDCDLSEETSQTICTELLAECLDRACEGDISLNSSSSSLEEEDSSTAAKDVRILCLERSIEEVKQRLTGMMHKESQDKQQPIGKLVITPERLKNNCAISQPTKNSPKLKIKLPRETSESPDSIKLTIKTPKAVANKVVVAKLKKKKKEKSEENKNSEDSPSQLAQVEKVAVNGKLPKKYSIFKTRNDSREQSPSLVKFTDKNARKSLNIRKSLDEAPDTPPQVGELRLQEENVSSPEVPLRIVIDNESSEDGDLQDEFARTVKQESPRGKMPVAQHDTSPMNPHARRNIFGTHSPICNDELSPEKRVVDVNSGTRPASRARGRVISTEEALQATNAVLDPYEMPAPEASHPQTSLKSPPPPSLTATPTPSLPLLSPQYDSRASTMTTPSLPSLSPAMPLLSRHSTPVPLSPDLSPHDQRLPRRPEGILPRRSQPPTPSSSLSSPTPSVDNPTKNPSPLPVSHRLSIEIPSDPAIHTNKPSSPAKRQQVAAQEPQVTSALPVHKATTPADTKTGRKMRDCRKFIHYEFSPPFMSSESSQSEVEVTEGEGDGMRKVTKKRGRPRKTLSMEEKPREESPTKETSAQQQKKRGRKPLKSKSTDDTMLQTAPATAPENEWPHGNAKRKRGRPPKVAPENGSKSMSVSQMASKLEESHVQSRSRIISQQRQSLLSRRCSEGSETKKLVTDTDKAPAQLRQERSHSFDTVDGMDQLTRQILESHPQLLVKVPPNSASKPEQKAKPNSTVANGTTSDEDLPTTTIVRKKVTVQRWSEPLMNIVDHLPKKNSPPPQVAADQEDPERPTTPPPGTCTIYQENLDLLDGMRVLTKIGPHFYPGKVTAVEGSSIFAVSVEGERGNKPHIYPAEVLLQKTLLDVAPGSRRYTPPGTRVCVLWSPKLNFLYPGTIKSLPASKHFVFVELDDGDQREIHIDNVRLLPRNYPKVLSKTKRESPLGEVEDDTMIRLPISAISPDAKKRLPGKPGNLKGQNKFHEKPPQKSSEEPGKSKVEIKDATLNADLLKDGLRILNKKNGHFYPGRLNAVRPPDIYGILLDNERGFRPNIYAREELLEDAIREVKVKTPDLPMGTRVCAYWSAKYHFLHPGTVIPVSSTVAKNPGKYLNVELDDGDIREVHIDQLRLLPPNYPKITYSDPLESPRKRSTSRPSTPRDGTRSDQSRPGSALSDFSDVEIRSPGQSESKKLGISFDASRTEVLNDLPINSPPPPILSPKESDPRPPKKPFSKIFIPPAVSKPPTTDLVGLISMGIDKLVDKKVVGNRNNFSPGFCAPPTVPSQSRIGPSPPPPPPTSSSSSSPSPSPSPSASMSPAGGEQVVNAVPVTETGAKAKSRLSSLIQAMSGKMKKPDSSQPESGFTPLPPPPLPVPAQPTLPGPPVQVNKWMTAFNVKPPLTSPSKDRATPSTASQPPAKVETGVEKETKSTEEAAKFRHKHNILLGYDFVDENNSDIMAWDMAVNRRKKTEKLKLLRENDIKEEVDEKPETTMNNTNMSSEKSLQLDVNNTMNTILTSITDEEKMRISLLSAALKKYSPIKLPGGNKSPKGQEETKKKKKKSAKRLSLSSDDENSRSERGSSSRRESEESSPSDGQPLSDVTSQNIEDLDNQVILPRRNSDAETKGEVKPKSQRNSADNFDDLLAICEESNIGVEAPKKSDEVFMNGDKAEAEAPSKVPDGEGSHQSICDSLMQKIGLTKAAEDPAAERKREESGVKSSEELRQESELISSQLAKFRGKVSETKKEKLEKKIQKLEESTVEETLSSHPVEELPNGQADQSGEPEVKLIKVDDQGDRKEQGKIKNGFVYRDPDLPAGWCIMMRRRENGKVDPFYIAPCHKRLRSKQEVVKYVADDVAERNPGKWDLPMPLEEMPFRNQLSPEDFSATKNIDPAIFVLPPTKVASEEPENDSKAKIPQPSENIVERPSADEEGDVPGLEGEDKDDKVDTKAAPFESKPSDVKSPLKKRVLKSNKISPLKRMGINKGKSSFNLLKKKKILKKHKIKIQNEKKRRLLRESIISKEATEKEHIFKVPSLERFQLQKRKSAKLASPTMEDIEARGSCSKRNTDSEIEKEDLEDDVVLNGITITKTVAVSIKRVKDPVPSTDENEVEEEEEEKGGGSNKENENSPEKDEEALPKRKTRNNIRSERPCPKSRSSKWKSTSPNRDAVQEVGVEDDGDAKQEEPKNLDSESDSAGEESPGGEEELLRGSKRKTRSSGSDPEILTGDGEDLDEEKMGKKNKKPKLNDKEENADANIEMVDDVENDECNTERAKTSPRINGKTAIKESVKEECQDNAQELKTENSSDENTQQEKPTRIPKTKCKLLGPRSRRKRAVESSDEEKEEESEDHEHKVKAKEANLTVVNEIECALSPPSPKKDATAGKDDEEGDDEDGKEEEEAPGFSPVPKSTYDFLLQRKHVRCDVKLVSLFQSELCKAMCHHCDHPESSTVHRLQVDLPKQLVYMECQLCGWTTVRRVTIAAVQVS